MKTDYNGMIFKYLYILKLLGYKSIYSSMLKLNCYLKGISIGSNISFYGKTYFYRKPFSKIAIGDYCGFRSKFHSNLIGINRPCSISTLEAGAKITIGDRCGFSGTVIGAAKSIILGNGVRCGANTLITDTDWHFDDYRSCEPAPVIIHDNVWLGEGAKVLKGVEIGENTVIGAGTIVTKSIPDNVIAGGNPCKVIKTI